MQSLHGRKAGQRKRFKRQAANGRFGGIRAGNASFSGTRGVIGLYAPNVAFSGPVLVGDISAADEGWPMLVTQAATNVAITGGDLLQANGRPVEVSGVSQMHFLAGTTSYGGKLPATAIRGRLAQNGVDVTAAVAVSP